MLLSLRRFVLRLFLNSLSDGHKNIFQEKTIVISSKRYNKTNISSIQITIEAHDYCMIEKPPSTGKATPVTKSEAGAARNIAAPARSCGSPHRPTGVRALTLSSRPGRSFRACMARSVFIQPGRIALT